MAKDELKDLLLQILANQVVLYKRIEDVENRVKGGMRSAPIKSYADELQRKSEEALRVLQDRD